jgi:ubiquinone/menaquinone biosynthesis C-methylase UbiE
VTTNVQVFDEVAGVYDEVLPFFAELGRQIVELVDPGPGTRLLDLGAGRGAVTGPALARGAQVTAVDASPTMVVHLAADHPDASVLLMDVHHLDFPAAAFDVAVAAFVLTLVNNPAAVLAEVCRVLSPGGQVTIATPGGEQQTELAEPDPVLSLYGEFAQYLPPGGSMGTEVDFADLLIRAGFVDVTNTSIEVCIEVPDAQTYWDWTLTHGSRAFADDLPADRRAQFRDRMLAQLSCQKVITLHRAAAVWTARRPL